MLKDLKKNLWSDKTYYERISKVDDLSHPGFLLAKNYCQDKEFILDVGCGDGTKLNQLGNSKTSRTGCEMGEAAVVAGKRKYKGIKFVKLANEHLPFENNSFDCVTCFFVLEHVDNPNLVLTEMLRVLKIGGLLILLAPNFGAPNRTSPNFKGNRLNKLFLGFLNDFSGSTVNNWNKVSPKSLSMKDFQMDLDTTIEPYLGSLVNTLKFANMEIVYANSYWEMELSNPSLLQHFFRFLASIKIYPFTNWGPHAFVVARK